MYSVNETILRRQYFVSDEGKNILSAFEGNLLRGMNF